MFLGAILPCVPVATCRKQPFTRVQAHVGQRKKTGVLHRQWDRHWPTREINFHIHHQNRPLSCLDAPGDAPLGVPPCSGSQKEGLPFSFPMNPIRALAIDGEWPKRGAEQGRGTICPAEKWNGGLRTPTGSTRQGSPSRLGSPVVGLTLRHPMSPLTGPWDTRKWA